VEYDKPQAATKLVSQAGKNVSRKTRKPARLKGFSFQNYQYNGQYVELSVNANFNVTHNWIFVSKNNYNYDVVC